MRILEILSVVIALGGVALIGSCSYYSMKDIQEQQERCAAMGGQWESNRGFYCWSDDGRNLFRVRQ